MAGQMRCVRFIGDVRMYVFPQSLVHPFFFFNLQNVCRENAQISSKIHGKNGNKYSVDGLLLADENIETISVLET